MRFHFIGKHIKRLNVHFVFGKILAKSLFLPSSPHLQNVSTPRNSCHQIAAMKSNRLWKAIFTQPSFPLVLTEKKIWHDNKKGSGTISKSSWRINPVQLYFLIEWNDVSFYIFLTKEITEREIEHGNPTSVAITEKNIVYKTSYSSTSKFECNFLIMVSFFKLNFV